MSNVPERPPALDRTAAAPYRLLGRAEVILAGLVETIEGGEPK